MKNCSYFKYKKIHLQIFSTFVHKNNLFLGMNVHYLSKKQPRTYFLSNLCKIIDIFANEIFHISNVKIFSYFEIEKILPFRFSHEKHLFRIEPAVISFLIKHNPRKYKRVTTVPSTV